MVCNCLKATKPFRIQFTCILPNDFCRDDNVDVTIDKKDACHKTCTKTLPLTMLIKIPFSK